MDYEINIAFNSIILIVTSLALISGFNIRSRNWLRNCFCGGNVLRFAFRLLLRMSINFHISHCHDAYCVVNLFLLSVYFEKLSYQFFVIKGTKF